MPVMPDQDQWSYVQPGDPLFADVDVVRFYLQDTDPNVRLLSDMELQYLIDQWIPITDSIIDVAAQAAELVATKFAGIVTVQADGVAVNVADLSDRYSARAVALRQAAKDFRVGEIDITNLLWDADWDWSIDPLQFGIGFQDNPEAGRQNYGTERERPYEYGEWAGWM